MRYSPKHKAETHERMITKAAEQFRRRGLHGIGIVGLMDKLGLTHGGFYAHFRSKNELIAAAEEKMFEEGLALVVGAAEVAPEGRKVAALIECYLSSEHRDMSSGCPLPSLTREMNRQPRRVRKAYGQGINRYIKMISVYMPGTREEERYDQARLLLCGMVGTMMIAKAMERESSDKLLEKAREFYTAAFQTANSLPG